MTNRQVILRAIMAHVKSHNGAMPKMVEVGIGAWTSTAQEFTFCSCRNCVGVAQPDYEGRPALFVANVPVVMAPDVEEGAMRLTPHGATVDVGRLEWVDV